MNIRMFSLLLTVLLFAAWIVPYSFLVAQSRSVTGVGPKGSSAPGPMANKTQHIEDQAFRLEKRVHRVEYSPDGKLLAGATDEKIYIWDSKSGELFRKFSDPSLNILLISFSTDGNQLIVLNADGSVAFFDIQSRKIVRKLSLPASDVDLTRAAISANKKTLVYEGNTDTPITICDLDSGKKIGTVVIPNREKPENTTCRMRLSPDGKTLAVAFNEKDDISLYAIPSGKITRTLKCGLGQKLDFSSDGRYLAVYASFDGDLVKKGGYIWDRQKELAGLPFDDMDASGLKFSPDGKKLFLWGQDGLGVLDMATGKTVLRKDYRLRSGRLPNGVFPPEGVFSPDGKTLAVIDDRDQKRIIRWDVDTGNEVVPARKVGPD